MSAFLPTMKISNLLRFCNLCNKAVFSVKTLSPRCTLATSWGSTKRLLIGTCLKATPTTSTSRRNSRNRGWELQRLQRTQIITQDARLRESSPMFKLKECLCSRWLTRQIQRSRLGHSSDLKTTRTYSNFWKSQNGLKCQRSKKQWCLRTSRCSCVALNCSKNNPLHQPPITMWHRGMAGPESSLLHHNQQLPRWTWAKKSSLPLRNLLASTK